MRNPFKRLFGISSSKPKHPKISVPQEDPYAELLVVWPDGTWNMPGNTSSGMDESSRAVLLDCAAHEQYLAMSGSSGRPINPGFLSRPGPIPPGWVPSEKVFKDIFAQMNWDTAIMHYMVGNLTHRGKMKP